MTVPTGRYTIRYSPVFDAYYVVDTQTPGGEPAVYKGRAQADAKAARMNAGDDFQWQATVASWQRAGSRYT